MDEARKSRARAPHQLPPGRHKLTRQYVEANQRRRILDAIADVSTLAGYTTMSVEDIISTAGVSRRTFYDHFTGKEEAFIDALDVAARALLERIRAALDESGTFAEGVRNCLAAFLEFVAEEPRYADMLIIEVLAAGPSALECRNRLMRMLIEMLRRGGEGVAAGRQPPELTAETIIGGTYEVVYARLLQGEAAQVPSLLPDLAYAMLVPYLGHEQASVEAARPRRSAVDARVLEARGA